jgi:hypothetical protein
LGRQIVFKRNSSGFGPDNRKHQGKTSSGASFPERKKAGKRRGIKPLSASGGLKYAEYLSLGKKIRQKRLSSKVTK